MNFSSSNPFPVTPTVESTPESTRVSFEVPRENFVFCDGHFPGSPLVPGAVLSTWMHETARLAGLANESGSHQLTNLKFRAPVVPGDSVTLQSAPKNAGVQVTLHANTRLCADGFFSSAPTSAGPGTKEFS